MNEEKEVFRPGVEFTLRLRVLKGDVPGALRVRQALKTLLRAYGLRNEGLDLVKPEKG
ncbi:MAG: hypothetical protein AB7F75_13155 [Planctomycetota bacterium]